MADDHAAAKFHPIAPRLKDGPKIPHIGPHFKAYELAHAETVGHESDKWWAKVRTAFFFCARSGVMISL